MSDLIERLRERADDMDFATNLEGEAADQLEAQQAEIARLQGLAEEAYSEGYSDGLLADPLHSYHEAWSVSDARRTLEIKT